MEIKCENSPSSKHIIRTRSSSHRCQDSPKYEAECNEAKPKIRTRRSAGGVVAPRYNTRSTKITRRRRSKAKSRSSDHGDHKLITKLKTASKLATSCDFASQVNITEPSGARRLLYPNAAQSLAGFVPDQDVRVEFVVRQSDLPKLTDFLGEPVVEKVEQEPQMQSDVNELYKSAEFNGSPTRTRTYTIASSPINRLNQMQNYNHHSLFRSVSRPFEAPVDYTQTVQKVKFYFHQLSPIDQRRFMEEMGGELTRRGGLSKWDQTNL